MQTFHAVHLIMPLLAGPSAGPVDPAEIRLNAILEAPVEQVWAVVSEKNNLRRWLFDDVMQWLPGMGGSFHVKVHDLGEVGGGFESWDAPHRFAISWPAPGGTLSIEVQPIDGYLMMVTLTHSGRPESKAGTSERAAAEARWTAAMMRLHRLFPPAMVETRRHRPRVDGLFIERSLIVNGDFEFARPGRYEGVAYGWEPNAARSSPDVHAIDTDVAHGPGRSQRIGKPSDWTSFAVQQYTSASEPLIEPGKRYRLSAMIKAEGIQNPAGWYRLGLWFTDLAGKPIGEPFRNEKTTDPDGKAVLNHDWRRYVIEVTAPPGATRAVVILTGHWDNAGTIWYDNVTLWEAEPPPTTRGLR